jgi:hypothetical protein
MSMYVAPNQPWDNSLGIKRIPEIVGEKHVFLKKSDLQIELVTFSLQILVPIANGSEEMEAVIIIDVLRRANADVVVASVEETLEIVASRKVKIVADKLIEDASSSAYDLIVLPVSFQMKAIFFNYMPAFSF